MASFGVWIWKITKHIGEMKTCKYCDKKFEPYHRTVDCWNCEGEGTADVYVPGDYFSAHPFERGKCTCCNGTGRVIIDETEYCSDSCNEAYMEEKEYDF
jgi:DnaJ-class molecular chaperone